MKTYEFAYGKGTQKVDLPEEHIIYDLHGKEVAVEKDIAAAALKAIRNPIDSKPLAEIVKPGEKIAIVVSDETRLCYTDQFLPVIVQELKAILILSSLPEPTGPRPRKRIFWCWGKPW